MNISISNLTLEYSNQELEKLFSKFGEVSSAEISMDGFTDQSRGFGFVEMPNDDEARAAIAALNSTELNGKTLKVEEAEPKDIRKGSYKVGNGALNVYRFRKN